MCTLHRLFGAGLLFCQWSVRVVVSTFYQCCSVSFRYCCPGAGPKHILQNTGCCMVVVVPHSAPKAVWASSFMLCLDGTSTTNLRMAYAQVHVSWTA